MVDTRPEPQMLLSMSLPATSFKQLQTTASMPRSQVAGREEGKQEVHRTQTTDVPFDVLLNANVKTTMVGFGKCKLGNHSVPTSFLHSMIPPLKCAACAFCLSRFDLCEMCKKPCRDFCESVRSRVK